MRAASLILLLIVRVPVQAIRLEGIDVSAGRRCETRPGIRGGIWRTGGDGKLDYPAPDCIHYSRPQGPHRHHHAWRSGFAQDLVSRPMSNP